MPPIDDSVLEVTAPLPYVPALALNGIVLGVPCLDGQQFEEGAVYTEKQMAELEQLCLRWFNSKLSEGSFGVVILELVLACNGAFLRRGFVRDLASLLDCLDVKLVVDE
eukprot:3442301-Rhodomonas_salina.1